MKHLRQTFSALILLTLVSGCGNVINSNRLQSGGRTCTLIGVFALGVIVDLPAGVSPEGVRITARENTFSDTLEFNMSTATHQQGATYDYWHDNRIEYDVLEHQVTAALVGDRTGTYEVTVTHPTLATVVRSGIVITGDECHAHGESVAIELH